jgi:hypothetical protein
MKTLWKGILNFLLQNGGIGFGAGLKRAENELKTTHISEPRLSLGEACFQDDNDLYKNLGIGQIAAPCSIFEQKKFWTEPQLHL